MLVGGYELRVYCDGSHTQGERDEMDRKSRYFGPDLVACLKLARRDGWQIASTTGVAWCPVCKGLSSKERKRRVPLDTRVGK